MVRHPEEKEEGGEADGGADGEAAGGRDEGVWDTEWAVQKEDGWTSVKGRCVRRSEESSVLYQKFGTIFLYTCFRFSLFDRFWGLLIYFPNLYFSISVRLKVYLQGLLLLHTSCTSSYTLLQNFKIQSLYRQRQYSQIRRV